MDSTSTWIILAVGSVAGLVVVIVLALLFRKRNQINLTAANTTRPEWMRQTPPAETIQATLEKGISAQVFDHAPGERLAAPFAEQIEDIVRARLAARADLSHYRVDFGTAPDGSLEIHIDDQRFSDLESIPDESLKTLLRQAIQDWQSRQ